LAREKTRGQPNSPDLVSCAKRNRKLAALMAPNSTLAQTRLLESAGQQKTFAPFARTLRRESLIILGLLLLTAVMTWPWVRHLRDGVADEADSYAHAYFLWWDYHQTFHDPLHLFDATIFYPYRTTLAFGENDYGIALLFFPLFAVGLRPLTVYSIAVFLSFPFTGYGMFRLSRTLSGSETLAGVAGIVFAFLPYRFHHLSHLPLIFAGWIPLLLESLILFSRERSWRRALWLGLAFSLNTLTCVTWFILTLIPLGLSAVFLLSQQRVWRDRAFWLRGGIALTAATLLLLPFLLPFVHVAKLYGFVRSPAEVQAFSAHLSNWFAVDEGNRILKMFGARLLDFEMALFPGLPVLIMAMIGFVIAAAKGIAKLTAAKQKSSSLTFSGELLIHSVIWSVIGFLGSFGLNSFFHRFLYNYLPLFRSMRVAVRWSMICYVGLAMLAATGAVFLAELLSRWWRRVPLPALLSGFVLLVLFDQWVRPFPLVSGKVDPNELALNLKEKKLVGGIVELPAGDAGPFYMLRAADHGQPLVVARNSFTPPIEQEIESLSTSQPIPDELFDLFERIPASYLVIHPSFMSPERHLETETFLQRALSSGRLRFVRSFDVGIQDGLREREDLYALVKIEPAARTEGPAPPPVSRAGLELLFNGPLAGLQNGGYFVYRLYQASYGRAPRFSEFMKDLKILQFDSPDQSKPARRAEDNFMNAWVNRQEFKIKYEGLNDEQYVDALMANTKLSATELSCDLLIGGLHAGKLTRTAALQEVVGNNIFSVREFNRAFVLLHYFTYLKRDPDASGFDFWLYKLDRHNDYKQFSEAFAASTERQLNLPQP
jgi:hypothetical protein